MPGKTTTQDVVCITRTNTWYDGVPLPSRDAILIAFA